MNLLRLWWTDAFDPAHCRVANGVRVTAICWVEGVCPPQPMVDAEAAPAIVLWSKSKITIVLCKYFWREQDFRRIPVILE